MKKAILTYSALLLATFSMAQEIAVQGIARNSDGQAKANTDITLSFSIYYEVGDTETPLLIENEELTTDSFGVFSHLIELSNDTMLHMQQQDCHLRITEGNDIISDEKLHTVPYAVAAQNGVPTGSIMPYIGTQAPEGWLLCNGDPIPNNNSTTALRNMVGSNTPNLQGMFLRGTGQSPVNNENGPALQEVQDSQNKNHDHDAGNLTTTSDGAHNHAIKLKRDEVSGDGGNGVVDWNFETSNSSPHNTQNSGEHTHNMTGNTAFSGGGESRPVNYGVNYIIKI